MHMVDRVISKNAEGKAEESKENAGRKSSNLLQKAAAAPEKKLMALFNPVLSKTNDIIKEYTNDEKAKMEKVIFALKSDKQTAESRVIEHEQKVSEKAKEFDEMKQKLQEMEKESYKLKLENEELKLSLQKERNVINDLMKDDNDKIEVFRKNDVSAAEKRAEEVKRENDRLLEEKYKLENLLAQQRKVNEETNNKLVVQMDEVAALKRENANLNDFISRKERQIKTLFLEIDKGKEKGTAEAFVDNTEKVKLLESELKRQDDEVTSLRKNLLEKTKNLSETQTKLENFVKETNWQKGEIQKLSEKVANAEKIIESKDFELRVLDDLQNNYVKSKQSLADILNLVFENRQFQLLEEIDRLIAP